MTKMLQRRRTDDLPCSLAECIVSGLFAELELMRQSNPLLEAYSDDVQEYAASLFTAHFAIAKHTDSGTQVPPSPSEHIRSLSSLSPRTRGGVDRYKGQITVKSSPEGAPTYTVKAKPKGETKAKSESKKSSDVAKKKSLEALGNQVADRSVVGNTED